LHVSLSEMSLKLPPSEPELFTISLILSVLINIFCEVFSELTQAGLFHFACSIPNINWRLLDLIDTLDVHAGREAQWFVSEGGGQLRYQQRHALSQTSKQLVAQAFPHESPAYTIIWLAGS
jgi:hypothetical protein